MPGLLDPFVLVGLLAASTRDPLTGVLNHSETMRALRGELARSKRYTRQCSLIVLDIDHFGPFNRAHGHAEGDRTLIGVASTLIGNVRRVDSVGRVGGDEFAVILPETGPSYAWRTAEKLSAAIIGKLGIIVSAGIACYPTDAAGELYAAADRRMFWAKRRTAGEEITMR